MKACCFSALDISGTVVEKDLRMEKEKVLSGRISTSVEKGKTRETEWWLILLPFSRGRYQQF